MQTVVTDAEPDFDVNAFFQTLVPRAFLDILPQIQLWEVDSINKLNIFLSCKEKNSILHFKKW